MLWGSAYTLPQGNAEVKSGVVVFWIARVPRESFTYRFYTRAFTDVAAEPAVPEAFELSIYPNPFTDRITIAGMSKTVKESDIALYDLLGRRQRVAVRSLGGGRSNRFILDTHALPVGLYFLRAGDTVGECYRIVKVR
ncbi:T9SS type A sorting domain-containing protein, partial [candidate division KSB1 bacterium]|nr:T9SS type A sorting domain-containing protein [candidate division KSB1 bacterium]